MNDTLAMEQPEEQIAEAAADPLVAEEAASANAAGDDPAGMIERLRIELAEERVKSGDLLDQYQRMAAEFQNSRRRQERQLAEEIERANAQMIKRLLPVVDDFDLALANVPGDLAAGATWVEGFRQIQKKLHVLLEDEGVTRIRTAGEFDPVLHEAIASTPGEDVPSGHILDTLRAGYEYKGRVLRAALVRIAQ
jgi:molecular chaperone GrpE